MTSKVRRRKIALALALIFALALLTGCFDRRELDTIAIVVGVGLDKGKEDKVRVTLQIVNVGAGEESDPQSASATASSFITISGEGPAVNYAIWRMESTVSRAIYLAHNNIIVIGEELAKEGVAEALDFFVRASEARMTVSILVAEGEARELLSAKTANFEQLPSVEIQTLARYQKITSTAPIVSEIDFVTSIIGQAGDAFAPLIRVEEGEEGQLYRIAGTAVFQSDKMVGKLNEDETQGMLHIQNRYKQGVVFVTVEDTPATIEIDEAQTQLRPEVFTDGTICMHMKVNITAGLGDQGSGVNLFTPDNMEKVKTAVADAVRQQIDMAVEKAREYKADIFGFGQKLSRYYPNQWKDLEGQWEAVFPEVQYDVEVNVVTKLSGRTTTFIKPQ